MLSVALLIVLAVILTPKLSANFPIKRQRTLNTFLQQTEQNQAIDAREFWQFREFYSPGHFFLAKDGNAIENIPYVDSLKIKQQVISDQSYFVSSNMQSIDGLTTSSSLSAIMRLPQTSFLIKKNTLVVYKTPHTVVMAFLLPPSVLKTTNGFLYKTPDSELQGKYWVDISVVKTN